MESVPSVAPPHLPKITTTLTQWQRLSPGVLAGEIEQGLPAPC